MNRVCYYPPVFRGEWWRWCSWRGGNSYPALAMMRSSRGHNKQRRNGSGEGLSSDGEI